MHIRWWIEAALYVTPWWAWLSGLAVLAAAAVPIWRS